MNRIRTVLAATAIAVVAPLPLSACASASSYDYDYGYSLGQSQLDRGVDVATISELCPVMARQSVDFGSTSDADEVRDGCLDAVGQ